MRGLFFEKIKSGKKVKVGGKFMPTHRDMQKQLHMPTHWEARALDVARAIAEYEVAKPTPAGEEAEITLPVNNENISLGKWVGRSDAGDKEVIFAAKLNTATYMFVENNNIYIVHDNSSFFHPIQEQDLIEKFMKAAQNTHNKYKGSKIAKNPATGATEAEYWNKGIVAIGGLDEAGRGAWAGPIVSAAVCLTRGNVDQLPAVQDSKALSKEDREAMEAKIKACVPYGVGEVSAEEIDKIGIDAANRLCFERAVSALHASFPSSKIDHLVIDGNPIPEGKVHFDCPYSCITQGEKTSKAVAAASILAKTHRDRILEKYGKEYPGYGFEEHKGYGTPQHQKALKSLGACACHRQTYAPIRKIIEANQELELG